MSFTGLGLASYASGGLGEERRFVPPDQKGIRSLTDLAAGVQWARLSSAPLNFHSSGWPGQLDTTRNVGKPKEQSSCANKNQP